MSDHREVWRDIPGYDGKYQVSSLGNVRRVGGRKRERTPTYYLLSGSVNVYGYVHVRLYHRGVPCDHRRARLVMAAFVGRCPAGKEVLHRDNCRTNDSLANLRYGTRAENEADKVAAGTANRGQRHGMAKLTEHDIAAIRGRVEAGELHKSISADFGVSRQTISAIAAGKLWRHTS